MAAHNDLGNKGEKMALHYLFSSGYEILETNYRFSRAEVDIIAKDNDVLVFVEVKSRSTERYGPPENAVDENKIILMMDAAYDYMEKVNHNWEIRFDIISIILSRNNAPKLKHLEDAFVP